MEPLKVSLPDPEHSHYDESGHQFFTHSHTHGGMHRHELTGNGRFVVVYGPGNFSPKASH